MKNYYIAIILLLAILVIIGIANSVTSNITANFGEETTADLGTVVTIGQYTVDILNRALDPADYITFSICKGSDCKSTSLRPVQSAEISVGGKNLKLELKSVMPRKSATFILTDLSAPKVSATVEPKEEPKEESAAPTEEKAEKPNIIQSFINWLKSLFGY